MNGKVPAAPGVPLITPTVLSASPLGNDPALIDQAYPEPVPPVPVSV